MQMLIALDSNRENKRLLKSPNRGIVVLRRRPTLDFTETKTTFTKLLFNKISNKHNIHRLFPRHCKTQNYRIFNSLNARNFSQIKLFVP